MNEPHPYPITTFVRYSTRVRELSEAWAFVMDHVDRVGDTPGVEISPVWGFEEGVEVDPYAEPQDAVLWFEVTVSGTLSGANHVPPR